MRLLVGRIGRAHGILGEATIEVRTDEPDKRFAVGAKVNTDKHGDLTIVSGRVHNGTLLLGFAGITTRNQIEELRNEMLYSDVDINESTGDEDEYHVLQLIGCIAYLQSGEKFGEVSDVINLPGQDLLAIETEQGEAVIPFVHQLVPEVDVKNKRMVVIPPTITGEIK
jgi:16S rRNA processing protein RimM